jgi:hypothetical protein
VSRNVAAAVRDTKLARERAKDPRHQLIQALIMDEVNKMTSLVADEIAASPLTMGSPTLPEEVVDTENWADALLED